MENIREELINLMTCRCVMMTRETKCGKEGFCDGHCKMFQTFIHNVELEIQNGKK